MSSLALRWSVRPARLPIVALALVLLATTPSASGQGTEPEERVALPVVVNVLKGIGCTDEEMATLIAAAIKRANEVLKPAGVILVAEETNFDVAGNGNADENGVATMSEAESLRDEGLKEVTGENADGSKKKGIKITFAKKFQFEVQDDKGNPETICPVGVAQTDCVPWIGIAKTSADHPHAEGETIGHELGHALGKLDDTYEKADCDELMYGWSKPDSPLKTSDDERKKIRKSAKDFGGRVLKEGEVVEAPKILVPGARGAGTPVITQNPEPGPGEKPIIMVSIVFPDPSDESAEIDMSAIIRCSPGGEGAGAGPAGPGQGVHFLHTAVDVDDDQATGFALGPFQGVEFHLIITWDLASDTLSGLLVNLETGDSLDVPVEALPTALEAGIFALPGGPLNPSLPLNERRVHLALDGAPVGMALAAPTARFAMMSTTEPLPPPVPGPLDHVLEVGAVLDDSIGAPALVTDTGLAVAGATLTITGSNMVAGEVVEILVNDTTVGDATVGNSGGFDFSLVVDPAVFGTDDTGYDFILARGSNGTAMTWVHVEGPGNGPDINGDGVVNVDDLVAVILAWGPCPPGPCPADVDGDGEVEVDDLVLVILSWS